MAKRLIASASLVTAGIVVLVLAFDGILHQTEQLVDHDIITPSALLGETADDFPRVTFPWDFRFPEDHGRHSQYRTEWWQLAGTLKDESEQLRAVQLTIVRISISSKPPQHKSKWATNEIYGSLLAINQPDIQQLYTDQRLTRGGALELAQWQADPMRLWVEDWWIEQTESRGGALDWKVTLPSSNLQLDLELHNEQPLVDMNNFIDESSDRAPPFVLYIQPRLRGAGTLAIQERVLKVSGHLSVEHAWGELPLPGGPVGRDRFTLHTDDGRTIFLVRNHQSDGSVAPTTSGFLIERDGTAATLSSQDIDLNPTKYWESDLISASYPIDWTLRIPRHDINLELQSALENGESNVWTPFWMGPVRLHEISGTLRGEGLIQLTGYSTE